MATAPVSLAAELTPVPETPAEFDPQDSSNDAPVEPAVSVEPVPAPDATQNDPFPPPTLSDTNSEPGVEGNEAGDALTGAAVSLAAARARLRQATIGNFDNASISSILKDLEILSTKLQGVIEGVTAEAQAEPEEPKTPADRKFSGEISSSAEIARLRSMRGELEIGNDYDETAAEQEISDLRRVRRQLRYLFALESRKLEVEISDPVVAEETVSSRRLSSRQWAQSLVNKIHQQ